MVSRCLFALVLSVILSLSVALPPDFFRQGRSGPLKRTQSKNVAVLACTYCEAISPVLAKSCIEGEAESRLTCLTALGQAIEQTIQTTW